MTSQGIDYFPVNTDFFNDDKIELIESEFGIKGSVIALRLLCKIYHEGYYYQWGDDECLLFAKRVGDGIGPGLVKEVVQRLVKRAFFDEGLFNSFQILTSAGIQRRWLEAVKRRKDVVMDGRFVLTDASEYRNVSIMNKNADILDKNADIFEQSKVEYSRVKESKERKPSIEGKKKDELSFSLPLPSSQYSSFLEWMKNNAPWCAEHLEMPTEEELTDLKCKWSVKDICSTIKRLENKKQTRKRYVNLYVTLVQWLEYDEKSGAVTKIKTVDVPAEQIAGTSVQMSREEVEAIAKDNFIRMLKRDAARGDERAKEELRRYEIT